LIAMLPRLANALDGAIRLLDRTIGPGWRKDWAFREVLDEAIKLWSETKKEGLA